jgi:hypothetical protein
MTSSTTNHQQQENKMSGYDQPLLPIGTPVKILGGGLFIGCTGKIANAYRIRHGHPMYDVEFNGGGGSSYHGREQLEVLEPEAPAREVIREDLVANPRTPNQVNAAVASLNRKLHRRETTRWDRNSKPLMFTEAKLEDGAISIRYVEPDRSMTGKPDKVWAEVYLDVNMTAVTMYRHARQASYDGCRAATRDYLENNPYGPTVTTN